MQLDTPRRLFRSSWVYSASHSLGMEQVIRLSREIENAVVADLEKICEISGNNIEVNQISDEIRMNLSSYLSE